MLSDIESWRNGDSNLVALSKGFNCDSETQSVCAEKQDRVLDVIKEELQPIKNNNAIDSYVTSARNLLAYLFSFTGRDDNSSRSFLQSSIFVVLNIYGKHMIRFLDEISSDTTSVRNSEYYDDYLAEIQNANNQYIAHKKEYDRELTNLFKAHKDIADKYAKSIEAHRTVINAINTRYTKIMEDDLFSALDTPVKCEDASTALLGAFVAESIIRVNKINSYLERTRCNYNEYEQLWNEIFNALSDWCKSEQSLEAFSIRCKWSRTAVLTCKEYQDDILKLLTDTVEFKYGNTNFKKWVDEVYQLLNSWDYTGDDEAVKCLFVPFQIYKEHMMRFLDKE